MIRRLSIVFFSCLTVLVSNACAQTVPTPRVGVRAQQVEVTETPAPTNTPVHLQPERLSTLSPTATRVPPTATPTPPRPIQLTQDGCCTAPIWSPDSRRVLFVDKPDAQSPTGLYAVNVNKPLGPPELYTPMLGAYSREYTYRAFVENQQTYIERVADKQRWRIDNSGRTVSFSPNEKWIAWSVQEEIGIFGDRRTDIFIATVDGAGARRVLTGLVGGGFSGWSPDSSGFLYSWRESRTATDRIVSSFSLGHNTAHELVRGERISNSTLSPNGTWLVYTITFSPDPTKNGIFIVGRDAESRRKLEFYGAYQWRDDSRLLYIPFRDRPDQSFQLFEYDINQDKTRRLLDPAFTPLFIAGGDWSVAPDSHAIVFVSSMDRNLYLINLP